jgi:hypothetical protein
MKNKSITKKAFKRAQERRKYRRGFVFCPQEKEARDIYSEGHFCGHCGSFMDDGVRYCWEFGEKIQF